MKLAASLNVMEIIKRPDKSIDLLYIFLIEKESFNVCLYLLVPHKLLLNIIKTILNNLNFIDDLCF